MEDELMKSFNFKNSPVICEIHTIEEDDDESLYSSQKPPNYQ
jgi:hypothetical protein